MEDICSSVHITRSKQPILVSFFRFNILIVTEDNIPALLKAGENKKSAVISFQ